MKDWDRLLPQFNLTLNLLRLASINSNISTYTYIKDNFDYVKMKVVAHEPETTTLAPPGGEAWTIGPSFDHNRCIKSYYSKTKAERDVKTVTFLSSVVSVPKVTTDNFLQKAALDIIKVLTQPKDMITLEAGDETKKAMLKSQKHGIEQINYQRTFSYNLCQHQLQG